MTAGNYTFICEQGASFRRVLTWKDSAEVAINNTGYTARMHIRATVAGVSTLVILDTTGTQDGDITLGGVNGEIQLDIDDEVTDTFTPGTYYYDLELEDGSGFVTRLIEGKFKVKAQVTREDV